jgi:hypothetical protein
MIFTDHQTPGALHRPDQPAEDNGDKTVVFRD